MSSAVGLVHGVLADTNPYVAPALLAVSGLAASWLALRRRRQVAPAVRRTLAWACFVLAGLAFLLGGALLARDAQLFWGAHWEDGRQVLVLERLGPLPNIRLPRGELQAVTEVGAPEHILFGRQSSVQFAVHTRAGRSYWSSPIHRRALVERARAMLMIGPDRPVERFRIGGPQRLN